MYIILMLKMIEEQKKPLIYCKSKECNAVDVARKSQTDWYINYVKSKIIKYTSNNVVCSEIIWILIQIHYCINRKSNI